MTLDH
jgi:hypothetical protein